MSNTEKQAEGHSGAPPSYEQSNLNEPKTAQTGYGGHFQPVPPPPGPPLGTTVMYIVHGGVFLTPHPTLVNCPNCQKDIVTNVDYESGTLTWLLVGGLLLLGCWMGCCLIPTCVNDCKDAIHSCPECKTFIGRYRRL